MKPFADLDAAVLARITTLATDVDDTLTTDGRLPAAVYHAIERLHAAGVRVVPMTGGPAGWCDLIARIWPVAAVVGENGAFYFAYDSAQRELTQRFFDDAATRARNRERLVAVRDQILREVPGCIVACDQDYRIVDLAIDYRPGTTRLPDYDIDRIVAIMHAAGMNAKVSSVHVNGWFGDYDKLGMTKRLFAEHFGEDLDSTRDRVIFVGDAPNDAPMFDYFPLSVGVANVIDFGARVSHPPKYVTKARSGDGFLEVAECLLAAKGEDQ